MACASLLVRSYRRSRTSLLLWSSMCFVELGQAMNLLSFIYGATAMGTGAIALFFFRFWRETRDRLFLLFAVAFIALTANRAALATVHVAVENVPYLYTLRLLAFALIASAIVDKNRSTS